MCLYARVVRHHARDARTETLVAAVWAVLTRVWYVHVQMCTWSNDLLCLFCLRSCRYGTFVHLLVRTKRKTSLWQSELCTNYKRPVLSWQPSVKARKATHSHEATLSYKWKRACLNGIKTFIWKCSPNQQTLVRTWITMLESKTSALPTPVWHTGTRYNVESHTLGLCAPRTRMERVQTPPPL